MSLDLDRPDGTPDPEAAHRDLDALERTLADALAEARTTLAAAEEENRRVRHELELVESSAGRRAILETRKRVRRLAGWLFHPLWSLGTAGRLLANRGWPATLGAGYRRLRLGRSPLQGLPPTAQETDFTTPAEAIRWIGPLRIGGETREALFSHPNSRVTYRLYTAPGSRIVTGCAIAPHVWRDNLGGVEFRLTVRDAGGAWEASRTLRVNPAKRWRDRRWRPLRLAVPASATGMSDVTLETTLPEGASVSGAWAVWGDPRLEWSRSWRESARTLRGLVARVRRAGLGAALRAIREPGAVDAQAAAYQAWVGAHTPDAQELAALAASVPSLPYRPRISIVTPVFNTDPRWLRACVESVRAQVYPDWELCLCDDGSTSAPTLDVLRGYEGDARIHVTYLSANAKISAASNAALATATGEFVALLDHDDELTPDALARVAVLLNEHPDADFIYSDEDKLDLSGGRCDPYFKPDWSPEHFLSCMYTCHLMVVRRSALTAIGGFRVGYEGAQDYDLVLRLMERTDRIHHLPRILYHWRKLPQSTASSGSAKSWALDAGRRALDDYMARQGISASVLPGGADGLYRIRFAIQGAPLVSLVIPTTGKSRARGASPTDLLAACLRSVVQKTSYSNYEVVVVTDEGRVSDAAMDALSAVPHRIVPYHREGPFNFSHKINVGVAQARGEHVVLFNDDLEVIGSEWLTAMLEYSQQRSIGAVGAKLLYPDGRLQHIGIVLGVGDVAAHAFHQHAGSSTGYASSAISVRNYSAVTGACLMSRRQVFEEVGGFDERFAVDFNDVDYCLRLGRAGYRVVFTPFAQLYHHESVSFGTRTQHPAEIEAMRARWGEAVRRDPYYNPNLGTDFPDYPLAR